MPLHYELQSGDIVEILTSKRERGPSRDWLALVKTTRARNKIKAWFKAESRDDSEHTGRELLQEHLNKAGLPAQKLTGSPLLADVIREMGFKKADDFYIALGGAKISPKVVVNKVMQRLKQGEAGVEEPTAAEDLLDQRRKAPARGPTATSSKFGIRVEGVADVPLRLAKCCRPVSGDPIVGYVSLGRGITIHRDDCPNVAALRKDPERFVPVSWDGDNETVFKVEIQVDAWDRHRLLEDLSRTFAEAGHQHRRGALHRPAPDDQEPLRDRGGGHAGAEGGDQPPARDRLACSTPTASPRPAAEPRGLRGLALAQRGRCRRSAGGVRTRLGRERRRACDAARSAAAGQLGRARRRALPARWVGRPHVDARDDAQRAGDAKRASIVADVVAVDLDRDRRPSASARPPRGSPNASMPRCLAIRAAPDSARKVTSARRRAARA